MKNRWMGITAAVGLSLSAQAATLTWDNGAGDSYLSSADNWNPNQSPSSGNDSLTLNNADDTGNLDIWLNSEFTVGSGQSFSGTNNDGDNLIFRMENGGDLTVAAGGVLDLTLGAGAGLGLITERGSTAASGRRVTLEDGATFKVDRYLTHNAWTTEFIASETGVATMEVLADLRFRNSDALVIDLSDYNVVDTVNGDTLVLFDYGSIVGAAASVSVVGYNEADWTLNYAYDQGGGDLGVAITVIPEPATLGLVAAMGGGILFIRRRFMM
jgi:hypothetical protein